MPRLAISEFSMVRWSLEEEIQELSRRGIREIGIWRTKLSDMDADGAADLLYSYDMRVSSLSWAGGFTGSCGMGWDDAVADGAAAIRTAARIGAECLIVHPGHPNGHTKNYMRRLFGDAINRMLPVAIDFGVTLGVEIMNRYGSPGWTVFDSFNESIDFVCNSANPNLGLVLDLFHVGGEPRVFSQLERICPRLALVQLTDRIDHAGASHRCRLGEGVIPVENWFNALEDRGYPGSWEVETFGQQIGPSRYRKLLDDSITEFERLREQRAISRGVSAS